MNRLHLTALACVVAIAPALSSAQPKAKAADDSVELPPLSTWTLPNGLTVAHMKLGKAPVATVQVWYHVGAKEEARDRRGSAHMFEHMMFKGTAHVRPEAHARLLNKMGGYVNAFTTEDVTAYHNTLPAQYMDFAVRLEAERMQNLLFRPKMIDTEREVVKEEIRQQENNPISKGFLRFLEVAYTVHPYAWTAGGTIEDLDKTTPADLEKFYKTYYVPNNAMLVVVGNVTKAEVEASAKKWFGSIPKGGALPRPADKAPEPAQKRKRAEEVEPGQIGLVIAGYHIPDAKHADIPALQVLQLILSAGESSRLHSRLVRKEKTAVGAGAQALVREHPGLLIAFAAYLDESKRAATMAAMFDELQSIATKGPTAREVEKAKNQVQAAFVEQIKSVTGIAQQIGQSWVSTGDPRHFTTMLDRIGKVTRADVMRVAKTYIKDQNLTIVTIPSKSAGGAKKGAK